MDIFFSNRKPYFKAFQTDDLGDGSSRRYNLPVFNISEGSDAS